MAATSHWTKSTPGPTLHTSGPPRLRPYSSPLRACTTRSTMKMTSIFMSTFPGSMSMLNQGECPRDFPLIATAAVLITTTTSVFLERRHLLCRPGNMTSWRKKWSQCCSQANSRKTLLPNLLSLQHQTLINSILTFWNQHLNKCRYLKLFFNGFWHFYTCIYNIYFFWFEFFYTFI